MLSLLLLASLSQVQVVPPAAAASAPAAGWAAPIRWLEGGAPRSASLSPVFVAEPAPSAQTSAALRALDPSATVIVETRALRLWRVRSPALVLLRLPALLPVLHDLPSTGSRLRVPLGVVCAGERQARPGLGALEWVSAHPGCLPDFWYRPRLK